MSQSPLVAARSFRKSVLPPRRPFGVTRCCDPICCHSRSAAGMRQCSLLSISSSGSLLLRQCNASTVERHNPVVTRLRRHLCLRQVILAMMQIPWRSRMILTMPTMKTAAATVHQRTDPCWRCCARTNAFRSRFVNHPIQTQTQFD
jgi:hypothetical protein